MADDVHIVVIRGANDGMSAYAIGDRIADSDWRVTHLSGGALTLEATSRFAGQKLEMHLVVGQSIDLPAMPSVAQPMSQNADGHVSDAKR